MFQRWCRESTTLAFVAALIYFIVLSCPITRAQATRSGSTEAIPSDYFGINIQDIAEFPSAAAYTGALGKAPAATWPYLEPAKGVFNWSRLDMWVAEAQAHGISIFYSNDYVPKWAAADPSTCYVAALETTVCTSTVANIQDWDDFVSALVTRYNGEIQIYELWNEPDEHYYTGTVAEMVTLTNHMYNIVRSLDPKATILSPSANNDTWLDAYWAAGGVKTTDVVSIHGYASDANDVPEVMCAFRTLSIDALMSQYEVKAPVWNTEGSWGGSNALDNPDLQAAFAARYLALNWACGVQRMYWYQWDGAETWPEYGSLWSSGTGLNEAGVAFVTAEKWLKGAVMPHSCLMNGDAIPKPPALFHGIYSCELTRPDGYQGEIVWNTEGSSTFRAPDQFTKYSNVAGQTFDLPASHEVSIGLKPILLEN